MYPATDLLADAVQRYDVDNDLGALLDRLRLIARNADDALLAHAAERYQERLEITMPLLEEVVRRHPADARALVALANAYWLTGRGPDVVGHLAERAKTADPSNRGAWHLWALAESDVRARVGRWRGVTQRFPQDQLARAALADNAASLAGAEHDPIALDLAIATYEGLLAEAANPMQRRALEETLKVLRGWKL